MGPPHMGSYPRGPNGMPAPMEGPQGNGGPPYIEPGGGPPGAPPGQHMQPPPPPFMRGAGGVPGGPHSPGLGPEAPPGPLGPDGQQRLRAPQMGGPPGGMEMGGGGLHPRGPPGGPGAHPFFMPPHMHMQGGPAMPPPPPPEAFGLQGPSPEWMHGPGGPPVGPHMGGGPMGPLMHPQHGDAGAHAAAADAAAGYHTGEPSIGASEQGGAPLSGPPGALLGSLDPQQQQQQQQGVLGASDAAETAAVKPPEEAEEEALFAWLEQVNTYTYNTLY